MMYGCVCSLFLADIRVIRDQLPQVTELYFVRVFH